VGPSGEAKEKNPRAATCEEKMGRGEDAKVRLFFAEEMKPCHWPGGSLIEEDSYVGSNKKTEKRHRTSFNGATGGGLRGKDGEL